MPAPQRKNLLASGRRRHDDQEEEEESVVGEFEDDSASEGSAASNGDDGAGGEATGSSDDEHDAAKDILKPAPSVPPQTDQERQHARSVSSSPKPNGAFQPAGETQAMLHGLRQSQHSHGMEEMHFEDLAGVKGATNPQAEAVLSKASRHETPLQRSRREHQEYIRQRDANPAFVPTRGGFFLHDDRSSLTNGPHARAFVRGRGRGYGPPMYAGRGVSVNEPTDRPWAHDLHEDHETQRSERSQARPPAHEPVKGHSERQPTASAPNRSFSFTTILGNVAVQISLPGMAEKKTVANVVRKQHTLLPQHRPPLRRDKPVRVSIPDQARRYIFPSADRSFIFIPRDLRPNQQGYGRGRGRGSFHGSRRPSVYGSVYTPSIAMSRKSSIGASTMRDGFMSPTESIMSRAPAPGLEGTRPIVRMPSAVPTPSISRTGLPLMNGQMGINAPPIGLPTPPFYGSHSTAIPMHQPRPQKTVSVADIESPASFQFKAPQQQQEQPFHQQVPPHISHSYADDKVTQPTHPAIAGMAGATPLSQIPEGAAFAQGYQQYPVMSGPAYFGTVYNNAPVFYPTMSNNNHFALPMTGPALAPSFVPGSQSHPVGYMPASGLAEGGAPGSMMAHESNGMVYYYNPPMYTADGQSGLQHFTGPTPGNMGTMANGIPSQPPFYYSRVANGLFFPAQSG